MILKPLIARLVIGGFSVIKGVSESGLGGDLTFFGMRVTMRDTRTRSLFVTNFKGFFTRES